MGELAKFQDAKTKLGLGDPSGHTFNELINREQLITYGGDKVDTSYLSSYGNKDIIKKEDIHAKNITPPVTGPTLDRVYIMHVDNGEQSNVSISPIEDFFITSGNSTVLDIIVLDNYEHNIKFLYEGEGTNIIDGVVANVVPSYSNGVSVIVAGGYIKVTINGIQTNNAAEFIVSFKPSTDSVTYINLPIRVSNNYN